MKRTLITGASSGIGRATARVLSAAGHRVVGLGRDVARLEAVRASIGDAFIPLPIDLDGEGAPEAAVRRAAELLGGLDGLVVAHGIAEHVAIEGLDARVLDLHYRTNLRAPLLLASAFAQHAATPATLIFVTSTLAKKPAPTTTAYAASKAGLLAAAQALALELLPRGIRVATVSPGLIDTDMIRPLRLQPGETPPTGEEKARREAAQQAALASLSPLGRLGQPDEIAAAIAYLFTTELAVGTDLVLDGGLTLR